MSTLLLGRRRALHKPRMRVQSSIKAEINVTPLVDVVLVLLVIFMLMVPVLNKGIDVDLPLTQHHAQRRDDQRDVVVAITDSAEIFVGSDRVSLEQLAGALAQQLGSQPNKRIVLRADGRSSYGQARRVIEAIHRTGNERIQLGTAPATEGQAQRGTDP